MKMETENKIAFFEPILAHLLIDHILRCTRRVARPHRRVNAAGRSQARSYKSKRKEGMKMKWVIYNSLGTWKATPKTNYEAAIQDRRKIVTCYGFKDSKEVRNYLLKYFHINENDIEIQKAVKQEISFFKWDCMTNKWVPANEIDTQVRSLEEINEQIAYDIVSDRVIERNYKAQDDLYNADDIAIVFSDSEDGKEIDSYGFDHWEELKYET